LGAALVLSFAGWTSHPRVLLLSAAIFGIAEIALAPITNFYLSLPILFVLGFFMVILNTLTNITLQTTTPDPLRGRVLSVYTTVFAGTTPLGSLYAGSIAEVFGMPIGLIAGGLPCLAIALVGLGMMRSTRINQ
jgi:uncharacterized membrane protein YvlD (DUF360 family)